MDNVTSKWSKIGEVLYKGVDAQTVADEIAAIGESATAEQIVERAKDEKSELHKCFTWDVNKAAQKCWIQEARNVVGCLVIKREEVKENEPEVRTFHKIDGCGYKPLTQVFKRQENKKPSPAWLKPGAAKRREWTMRNKDSIKFNHLQGFPRKRRKKNGFAAASAALLRFCTALAGNRSGT